MHINKNTVLFLHFPLFILPIWILLVLHSIFLSQFSLLPRIIPNNSANFDFILWLPSALTGIQFSLIFFSLIWMPFLFAETISPLRTRTISYTFLYLSKILAFHLTYIGYLINTSIILRSSVVALSE